MNLKRAIGFGALAWIVIFFEVSILMFGFGLKNDVTYYTIHYVLSAIILWVVGALYFRGKSTRKGALEGLKAGLVFLVTGIIIDAIITVPLFVKSYSFFANPLMWVSYLIGVLVVVIIGWIKK